MGSPTPRSPSPHALPRRPVRPRRHVDRLGADHPGLDEARVALRARTGARRGARALGDRWARPDRADARPRSGSGRRARRGLPPAQRAAARGARGVRRRPPAPPAAARPRSTARDRHREAPPHRRPRARSVPRSPRDDGRGDRCRGHRAAQARPGTRVEAPARLDADPADAAYVGDSPYHVAAGNAASGVPASPSAGAVSTPTSGCFTRGRTCSSTRPRSSMASKKQLDVASRAAELRRLVAHHNHRYHVLDDPEIPDSAFDVLFDELKAIEEAHPELVTPDPRPSGSARCRPRASEGGAPAADGVAREGDDREALEKWAEDVRKRLGPRRRWPT